MNLRISAFMKWLKAAMEPIGRTIICSFREEVVFLNMIHIIYFNYACVYYKTAAAVLAPNSHLRMPNDFSWSKELTEVRNTL